ncbi:MAG: chemotaxis response regulator protein-glutamate methylesterase [Eubacteriales bacterium]|nr:chemotaxis response regulator protein-glutamate methylesterase [Eubacteriales bacterium]
MARKIKVLIVNDSLLFRETLAQEIAKDFGIEVVGTAEDPFVARDKILELQPDVVTLDVEMPKMDGIAFLKKLMPQYPLPVVVISSVESNVFEALSAGAVDFVAKPKSKAGTSTFYNELIVKIKIASTAKVAQYKLKADESVRLHPVHQAAADETVIAIGASTGGTEALASIINVLPAEMPGIVIVQHMPPVFTKMYAERLNNSSRLKVKEAQDGDELYPGMALVAPGDYQMEVVRDRGTFKVKCFKGEKVSGHCPSVDVLFRSVASTVGKNALGVILTGMGSDGAKGLLEIRKKGAFTIGQDEKSSIVYGMPMVAYNIGAVARQLPLDRIPQELCDIVSQKNG